MSKKKIKKTEKAMLDRLETEEPDSDSEPTSPTSDWRDRFVFDSPQEFAEQQRKVAFLCSATFRGLIDAALEVEGMALSPWLRLLVAERVAEVLRIPLRDIPEYGVAERVDFRPLNNNKAV